MKRFITFLLGAIAFFNCHAQFYQYTPQQIQQMTQQSQEAGRRAVENAARNLENAQKSNPSICISKICSFIGQRNFDEARKWCNYLKDIDTANGHFYLGLVDELRNENGRLGIKDECIGNYTVAYTYGHPSAKDYCDRLYNYGPMTSQQVTNVVNNMKYLNDLSWSMAQSMINDLNSSSSSSSSSRSSRNSSGTCSRCHGTRIDPVRIDYQPGSSTGSSKIPAYTKCPYCGETKTIDHWHERCLECSQR